MLDFDYWASSSYYTEQFQVFAIGADSNIAITPVIAVTNSTAENMLLDLSDHIDTLYKRDPKPPAGRR